MSDYPVDTRGVEDFIGPVDTTPSTVLDSMMNGGRGKWNGPTNAPQDDRDSDVDNSGTRGISDTRAKLAMGFDPGD